MTLRGAAQVVRRLNAKIQKGYSGRGMYGETTTAVTTVEASEAMAESKRIRQARSDGWGKGGMIFY